MKSIFYSIIALILLSGSVIAQQDLGNGWKLNGQVRLRSEVDGRDFSNSTHPLTFASSRIRLGVQKTFDEKITIFIQMQDSRVFGFESNTLSSSTNFDIHQGYVKLNYLFDLNWSVQAGRFEVSYGTQRFIGAVGWHFVGRSFDGIRATIAPKKFNLDVFALTVNEPVGYIGNAKSSVYPFPQQPTPAHSIYGVWKKTKLDENNKFDVFGYWELNRKKAGIDTFKLGMLTFGGSYWGTFGRLSTIIEGAYQLGKMSGHDISAYIATAALFYKAGSAKFGLGADLLSGTDPEGTSGDMNTYQASYATNHKFYGFMDYFINTSVNTMNLGLNDFYATVFFKPKNSKWNFGANFHHFMSNKSKKLVTVENSTPTDKSSFGQEIDVTVKYAFVKGTTIVWGGSVFFPGTLMKYKFQPREDAAFWTYLMITANL